MAAALLPRWVTIPILGAAFVAVLDCGPLWAQAPDVALDVSAEIIDPQVLRV